MARTESRSISRAKEILRRLDNAKPNRRKDELLREYTEVLNLVVHAISELTADADVRDDDSRGEASDTSETVPETIASTSDSVSPFSDRPTPSPGSEMYGIWTEDGEQLTEETVLQQWNDFEQQAVYTPGPSKHRQREPNQDRDNNSDAESVTSDIVPFTMTDDDALDEILLTRELMGYEEGFNVQYCSPITEEKTKPQKSFSNDYYQSREAPSARPPRYRRTHRNKKKETTKPKRTHRRQRSGGSAPTVLEGLAGTDAASHQGSTQGSTQSAPATVNRVCPVCQHLPPHERCKEGTYCI